MSAQKISSKSKQNTTSRRTGAPRKSEEEKKAQTQIRMDPVLKSRLLAASKKANISSISGMARKIILDYLDANGY